MSELTPEQIARWQRVEEAHPPRHARHAVIRDGNVFTATPCYGMHEPWWVVRTMAKAWPNEADPVAMKPDDLWMPIEGLATLTAREAELAEVQALLRRASHDATSAAVRAEQAEQQAAALFAERDNYAAKCNENAMLQREEAARKGCQELLSKAEQQAAALTLERDAARLQASRLLTALTAEKDQHAALTAKVAELEAHEQQTHEQLGAILGTDDALHAVAARAVATNAALTAKVGELEGELLRAAGRVAALTQERARVREARNAIEAMPTREEWLGGQRTRYVQVSEVLYLLDAALARAPQEGK
jgi:hypothetical protein